ncbi:cellulose binding domain-containing protein [Streptomyces sp. ISL-111]|nr:cellulose binding domain-containing protein [Streptomyces sp. ISL-111]
MAAALGVVLLGALGPAAAQARPAAAEAAVTGLHVSNGRLLEANGNDFVMRGVNHAHTWYPGETQSLADIKALGANAVRVVLSDGHRWTRNGPDEVAGIVDDCKSNRLICVLEVHDTTGYGEDAAAGTLDHAADYWISLRDVVETTAVSSATTSATVTGLAADTVYTFAVYARDAVGNRSARSATVNVTTDKSGPTPGVGCSVGYRVVGEWPGGFQGEITIRNTGTTAINGWNLAFVFVNGQKLSNVWGGTATQSGSTVSVAPAGYTARRPFSGAAALLPCDSLPGRRAASTPRPLARFFQRSWGHATAVGSSG